MAGFLKKVDACSRWRIALLTEAQRAGARPRAHLNVADLRRGAALAVLAAPEHAPPEWLESISLYVPEEDCERIFEEHLKNITLTRWDNFAFDYGKKFAEARAERYRQRRIRRNKRAYNFWCGYVMGMKVAFALAESFFKYRFR